MPEVSWIKITTDMFDDEKIKLLEAMPDADTLLVIWVKLICQAGKVNTNGYIFLSENLPYSEEQLATIFNRPVNTVKLALRAFHQLEMIHINDNGTIYLPNFSKHQNIEGLEKIREQTRIRVAKHREIKAGSGNNNVTDSNVTVTQQRRVDKSIDKSIDIIYTVWNSQNIIKHQKLTDEIQRSIITSLKTYTEEQIIQGIENYGLIVNGEEYYWTYSWTLKDFLKRGLEKFQNVEVCKKNYKKDEKNGAHQQNPGKLTTKYTRPEDLLQD